MFHVFANKHIRKETNQSEEMIMTEDEYNSVQSNKIAFAQEPLISQISSVSIPILSHTKELVGIISVVGFPNDIPRTLDNSLSTYLIKMQAEISHVFGYL